MSTGMAAHLTGKVTDVRDKDRETLRGFVDGNDKFMNAFRKTRLGGRRARSRPLLLILRNDSFCKELLLHRFPQYPEPCANTENPGKCRRITTKGARGKGMDAKVRAFRNRRCPSCEQKLKYFLWDAVIKIYMRTTVSMEQALDSLTAMGYDISATKLRDIARRIKFAALGERSDGKPRTSGKPGRPRKSTGCAGKESFLTISALPLEKK